MYEKRTQKGSTFKIYQHTRFCWLRCHVFKAHQWWRRKQKKSCQYLGNNWSVLNFNDIVNIFSCFGYCHWKIYVQNFREQNSNQKIKKKCSYKKKCNNFSLSQHECFFLSRFLPLSRIATSSTNLIYPFAHSLVSLRPSQ